MRITFFQGVRIIDSKSPFHGQIVDVRMDDGVIVEIGTNLNTEGLNPDDIHQGNFLSPGWIDMRIHLTDPGFEYKEDLGSLTRAALRGGYTSLVTLPNTKPTMDNHGQIRALLSRSNALPVRILPCGSLSQGGEGKDLADMYDLSRAGAVAFSDGIHSVKSAGLLLRGLQYLKAFDGLLMDSPLIEDLLPGAQVAEGFSSTNVGLKGIPALAETLAVDRNLQVLSYFSGRLHLGPLTTKAGLERVRVAKQQNSNLSIETSVYHLIGNDTAIESFNVNAKVWPPLRTEEDRLAILEAISDGTIDVVSSNHHPQSVEEKKHDFVRADFGISSIEVAFGVAGKALKNSDNDAGLERMVATFSTGPAQVLQLENYSIEKGNAVDLTWFDPHQEYQIAERDFLSKGKNQAFAGLNLRGKALGTVCRGTFQNCP